MHYNYCRIRQTLRVTPAMEAGLTDHLWELDDLVALLHNAEQEAIAAGAMKRGPCKTKTSDD